MGKKRVQRLFLLLCVISVSLLTACGSRKAAKTQTLTVWYTEKEMLTYLEKAADAFKKQTGVNVNCCFCDSKDYIDEIHRTSLENEKKAPDIFLIRHDRLGRVCMQGMAAANVSGSNKKEQYCEVALDAASYKGKLMAYPLYYNTGCMLYRSDYFTEAPVTMGAVTAFSETAQIGENVRNILYWDIGDYFCNYSFVGAYLFQEDDKTAQCLEQLRNLGQYFALNPENGQEEAMAAFKDGETLCVLTDSDRVADFMRAAEKEKSELQYRIWGVPDVSDELKSCAGSYTELAVVNGMSLKQDAAAEFAEFLTDDCAEALYERTGHFPAKQDAGGKELSEMYQVYRQSRPFPNELEKEDLSVHLGVLFANVWSGSDIATELQSFTEKMQLRLNK